MCPVVAVTLSNAGELGRVRDRLEFFLTGAWLGVSQVALAFHLLFSQGASVIYYFGLVSLWLFGSVVALLALRIKQGVLLKLLALVFFVAAIYLARWQTFGLLALATLLGSVVSFGFFAGWFLRNAVDRSEDVRGVMLHENNGFIFGYALAGVLLFYSTWTVDLLALGAGTLLYYFDFVRKFKAE